MLFLGFGAYAESSGMLTSILADQGVEVAATDMTTFISSHEDLGFLTQINWVTMLLWECFST